MKSKRAREAADVEDRPADETADVPAKKRKRTDEEDGESLKESKPKKEKKDKKDKKDKKKDKKESRKERKDKRKDLQDLPEDDPEPEDDATGEPGPKTNGDATSESKDGEAKLKLKQEKKEKKKEKKEKKKKENKTKHNSAGTEATANGTTTTTNGETPSDEPAGAPTETNGELNGGDAIDLDASAASKADRHIVFVGNLPYTATAASISAHFASLSPIAVRCLKNRDDSNPCRGIAFVEFGKVWHQRTCLDKFHHSVFNDGVSPARKINVELT
jgi:nucleolar protein 6